MSASRSAVPRRGPRPLATIALAAAAALGLFAGCGSGSSGDATPEATTEAVVTEAATAVEPEPDAGFTPTRTYEWRLANASGNAARVRVDLGEIVPAGDSAQLPSQFLEYTAACDTDPQRDAFLPLSLTATNTTPGFDTDLTVRLLIQYLDGQYSIRVPVLAATTFSDGSSCGDAGGTDQQLAGVELGTVAPEESRDHQWLLVLKDYYSPANPSGDDAALARAAITVGVPSLANANDLFPRTTCFTGTPNRFFRGSFLGFNFGTWGAFPVGDVRPDSNPPRPRDPPNC